MWHHWMYLFSAQQIFTCYCFLSWENPFLFLFILIVLFFASTLLDLSYHTTVYYNCFSWWIGDFFARFIFIIPVIRIEHPFNCNVIRSLTSFLFILIYLCCTCHLVFDLFICSICFHPLWISGYIPLRLLPLWVHLLA